MKKLFTILLMLLASSTWAGISNYDDGLNAYVKKDYTSAAYFFKLAAKDGDARAQYELGDMYEKGQGLIKNYVLAYMWFNLASVNGTELVAESRERLVKKMTAEQILDAQKMTREYLNRDYKNCD